MNKTKMSSKILSVLILAIVLVGIVDKTNGLSCEYTGRLGCLVSCYAQNCSTGYCNAANVCVCSRCGTGGIGKRSVREESIQRYARGTILNTFKLFD